MVTDALEQLDSGFTELGLFTFFRGRAALTALLKALGVRQGDFVATQAFTCVAVPEAILASGASPLFIDIEKEGVNMCAQDLAQKLDSRVRAVMIQHTFGLPANMEPLLDIAEERGLPVIEDCCHTFESSYRGRTVGTFGVGGFYSFEWGKPVIAGVGGGLRVNDNSLTGAIQEIVSGLHLPPFAVRARMALQYQVHKILYHPRLYWPVRSAYRLASSLGLAQGNFNPVDPGNPSSEFGWKMLPAAERRLRRIWSDRKAVGEHSREVVRAYREKSKFSSIRPLLEPKNSEAIYARFPLRVPDKQGLLDRAKRAGVELADWYKTPIHPLPADNSLEVNYAEGSCPNAERRCQELVSLPVGRKVSSREIDRAVALLNRFD